VIREFARNLSALLRESLAKLDYDQAHSEAVCIAMIGGMNELIADWVLVDQQTTVDDLADLVADTTRAMFPRTRRRTTPAKR
jgi:hypothetical protein